MKRTLLIALCAGATLFAQSKGGAQKASGGAQEQLARIEQEMLNALLKGDASGNERYMSDTVVLTTPDGDVIDKARAIAEVKNGDLKLQSSTISDLKVRVSGDTAVVTYATTDKGTYKGRDIGGQYRWTDVFMRRGDSWQLIAGHGCAKRR